jgi:hypothetical protein
LAGSHKALTAPSKNKASRHLSLSRKKRANLPSDTESSLMTKRGRPPGAMPTPLRMWS